jgi:integrase
MANERRSERPFQRKIQILSTAEINAFLKVAKETKFFEAYLLELSAGLRCAELLGLRWSDFNFEKGVVNIRKRLAYTSKGLVLEDLKTKSSRRTINLSVDVLSILQIYKKERTQRGSAYQNNDLVVCCADGSPIYPRLFLKYFKDVLKKTDLDIRFHDLRYSVAGILLRAGTSIKIIQEIMGYSSIIRTLGPYIPAEIQAAKREAAEILGGILKDSIRRE